MKACARLVSRYSRLQAAIRSDHPPPPSLLPPPVSLFPAPTLPPRPSPPPSPLFHPPQRLRKSRGNVLYLPAGISYALLPVRGVPRLSVDAGARKYMFGVPPQCVLPHTDKPRYIAGWIFGRRFVGQVRVAPCSLGRYRNRSFRPKLLFGEIHRDQVVCCDPWNEDESTPPIAVYVFWHTTPL